MDSCEGQTKVLSRECLAKKISEFDLNGMLPKAHGRGKAKPVWVFKV